MLKKLNYIFYFPYKKVGGVSVLFIEVARLLSKTNPIYLVDFVDGYIAKRVPQTVKFIDFEKNTEYPKKSILILQSIFTWRMVDLHKFDPNTKVIFWNLHPDNFAPFKLTSNSKRYSFKYFLVLVINFVSKYSNKHNLRFIKLLNNNNSIYFMDESNYFKTKEYYPSIEIRKNYLPCYFPKQNVLKTKSINNNFKKLVTIGRLVDFKIHILNHLITRLNNFETIDFNLTIIGDGDEKNKVLSHIRELDLKYDIIFINEKNNSELGEFLLNECDILFAMGLSALEGAARLIPTFILDYSFKPIDFNYKFKLIYENKNFNLACEINLDNSEISSTLENMVIKIFNNYKLYSNKCYNYWLNNHSEEIFVKIFDLAVKESNLTVEQVLKNNFQNPDLITKIYYQMINKNTTINKVHGFRYPSN